MSGFQKQFIEAYDTYADALYRFFYFRIFSESRAEDLAQETFLRVWNHAREGGTIENLKAFLYKVATNLMIDEKRRWREVKTLEEFEMSGEFLEKSIAAERMSQEDRVMLNDIYKELKNLREDEAELITMRFVDDLGPKEIAELRGTSPNTISVQINRILEKLRGTLRHDA